MAVYITKNAISAIIETMKKSRLSIEDYVFDLGTKDGGITVAFSNEITNFVKLGDLKVRIDPRLELGENLVVDYVIDSQGKRGLIFSGEKKDVS